MDFNRRLLIIETEGDRLADLARGHLEDPVPTCPAWTLRDLVQHLTLSFLDKVACTRLNAIPDPSLINLPLGDPIAGLLQARDEMVDLFRECGPAVASYTWEPSDQSVGFWARRMAVETSIHCVDAAVAVGSPYDIDTYLATDGIDETLGVILGGDWSHRPQSGPDYSVLLRASDQAWLVALRAKDVEVVYAGAEAPADAAVKGDPEDLLLWLWGRPTRGRVVMDGDDAALVRLMAQLQIIVSG